MLTRQHHQSTDIHTDYFNKYVRLLYQTTEEYTLSSQGLIGSSTR